MKILAILFVAATVVAAMPPAAHASPADTIARVRDVPSPAGPGSGEPSLALGPQGDVFMSWIESRDKKHALRIARLRGRVWSKPVTIVESESLAANWANFPALLALDGRRLAVAYTWQHPGDNPHATDVRIAQSTDGGRTWGKPVTPHRDGTATEHGFVALVPAGRQVRIAWLDGRKFAAAKPMKGHEEPEGDMTLRSALVGADGSLQEETELDGRVCDCCQTGAAATLDGAMVVYRDRGATEVRDISQVRLENGSWSAPAAVSQDGWEIAGCPVNGPAIDVAGAHIAVAWFSAPRDSAAVRVALSSDGGKTFGPATRVDGGSPIGRVDVVVMDDGSAVVSWLESQGESASIQARRVTGAVAGPPLTVARTGANRASGFPRMKRTAHRLVFAWTETGKPGRVRVAESLIR